ncbi:MAG: single-stranded DNA-binding protein [Planctomycetia bacterium]|nr:single-stranded DNA-binding protein [Planctomycetia bacterium]
MASYNRVILLGNMTRDPEVRYTPSGTAVCEIGMAINDRRRGTDGDWVEETTFVDVTLWGKTAETCGQYLTKGSSIMIEGRLKLDTWEQEGAKRSKLRVVAERMQMLGSKNSGGGGRPFRDESEAYGGGYGEYTPPKGPGAPNGDVDDIPF